MGGDDRMRLLRPIEIKAKQLSWIASHPLVDLFDPDAADFCEKLLADSYEFESLVNVMPAHKLLYVAIPKAASTRIRQTLARVGGRRIISLDRKRRLRYRGPYGPRSMTKSAFYRLATNPQALRFSFVRNPYARAVSCWADKFRGRPLVAGDPLIDVYLARRPEVDADLPAGPDRTLSFADYVVFAAAMAKRRYDIHLQAQDEMLRMPGVEFGLIGKVESFNRDFARVLDHLGASDEVRRDAAMPLNESGHDHWSAYYTTEIADHLYAGYERDFDRFEYARAITQAD